MLKTFFQWRLNFLFLTMTNKALDQWVQNLGADIPRRAG